jgi:hypothetical protein
MNEFIPTQALETLIAHQGKPAVSIYLPTTRIPTRVQAESLQFKNLLRDAEEQLAQFELRGPEIRAMLEPAYALIADSDFWRHQRDGLAVFIAEGIFQRYQVPTSFDMGLFVSEYFHLKPLIPLITDDFPFYILAVSQNLAVCKRSSTNMCVISRFSFIQPPLPQAAIDVARCSLAQGAVTVKTRSSASWSIFHASTRD